jgi:hypothetical protein
MDVHTRTGQNSGCPFCAGKRVLAGFNDLATTHPQFAIEADGWDPKTVSAGSHEVKNWKCQNDHTFRVNPNQRTSRTSNCPTCANLTIEIGFNDLLTLFPGLAAEANGWDPREVGGGSSKRLSWRCNLKGHVWESTTINRTSNGSNCPVCVGQLVIVGVNDLLTTHPQIAKQAIDWDPSTLTAGSKKKRGWLCDRGHKYKAQVVNKTNLNSGCPICANVQVQVGYNDLLTTHPELSKEAEGWDPSQVVYGSRTKKKWKCQNGHSWIAAISNRTGSQQQGCPSCAATGYDPNKIAWLYFIEHQDWEMFQVGITNNPDRRLGQHKKLGWEVLELRGPMDGHLTQQWETAILRMLKAKGADLSNAEIAGKFDGYSEAWSKSTFEVNSIKELMRMTEEFES